MCACWGRLLSDGMRARLLIHACETTVTPAHDEPLEGQAARAQTNSGYARNGTLFPQVYRAAAPPFASKKFACHGFFPRDECRHAPPTQIPRLLRLLCQHFRQHLLSRNGCFVLALRHLNLEHFNDILGHSIEWWHFGSRCFVF
jgi:hypothetical protein